MWTHLKFDGPQMHMSVSPCIIVHLSYARLMPGYFFSEQTHGQGHAIILKMEMWSIFISAWPETILQC
jgi:hypothetical protein